jgi:hypothetical protein
MCRKKMSALDGRATRAYTKEFGFMKRHEGDVINESKPLDPEAVRQVPHSPPQTAYLRDLREPEAQAATRIG